MELFDKDGNPVTDGIFTQEELDAKIAEAKTGLLTQEELEAKIAEAKAGQGGGEGEEVPEYVKTLQAQVDALSTNFQKNTTSQFVTGLDADKKEAFNKKFEELSLLSSYDKTPEGIQRRAADAYQLTVGQPFDFNALNMGNLGNVGAGGVPPKPNAELSEVDKGLGQLLGNTEEDYKKFGGEQK